MTILIDLLIGLPERLDHHFAWLGPLAARLVVGWSFGAVGGKLDNLQSFTSDFAGWGIIYPQILAPFVAGVEFVAGILLILVFSRGSHYP